MVRRWASLSLVIVSTVTVGVVGCGRSSSPPTVRDETASPQQRSDGAGPRGNAPPKAGPVDQGGEKSPSSAPAGEPKEATAPPPTNAAPKARPRPSQTVTLTATAFAAEIDRDRAAAAKKFAEAYVELNGIVRSVGSRDGTTFITLDAGPASLGVRCLLAKEPEPWAKVARGSKVKVRGVWPEWSDEHRLDECELLETGPNPAVEIAAEALAEQFAKNKEATRAKFQDRFLLVTGILVDREVNETGAVRLWLKGAGDLRVDCGFDAPDRSEAERPPLGSGVRLVGEFSLLESHSAPALRGCRLITNPR